MRNASSAAQSLASRGVFSSALRFLFGLSVTALVLVAMTSEETLKAPQRGSLQRVVSAANEAQILEAMKRHYPETRHRGSPSVQRDAMPPAQPDEGRTDPALRRVDSADDAPSREAMNYALAQTEQRRSPPAQTSDGRTEDPALRRVASADDAPSREAMNYALPQTASLVKRNEPVRPETTTPAIQAPPSVKSLFSGASWGTDDWNESVVVPVGKPPQPTGRVAYAWYLAGEPRQFEDYACAILVNAWFIKQNGLRPNADMIAVHFEEVPRPERFEKMGVKLIKVQAAVSRGKWQWLQSFLKLRVASLYQYDRIIYMDADSFPIGSLDNLFELANFPVEIATPIAYWQGHSAMTGGPVIIDPRRVFYDRDFTGVLDTNINLRDNSEMDWVNRHFKNTISLLPGFYAMLISEFCGKDPTYRYWQKHFGQSARWVLQHAALIHFIADWKPWNYNPSSMLQSQCPNPQPELQQIYNTWWRTRALVCK